MGSQENDYEERFIRWQKYSIEQMSYVINLILGFTIASLGYCLNLLQNDKFVLSGINKFLFQCGFFLLFVSLILGLLCVINRLTDFRMTKTTNKMRKDGKTEDQIMCRKNITNILGKITWWLFYFQISSFFLAIISIALSIMIIYQAKLF